MNEIINLGNGQFVKVVMLKGMQGDNITSIANGDFVVKSPVTTNTISSITVTGTKGVLRPETMPTIFKFVFTW